MINQKPSRDSVLSTLRLSIYDGVSYGVMGNLTGSVFLPAFALALGANALHMGIISAIPLFSSITQFFGAFLVEKIGKVKKIVILSATIGRMIWIPFIILSVFISVQYPGWTLLSLMILLLFFHLFASITDVSWFTWMSDLVPEEVRGRFFGLRNICSGGVVIIVTLIGGWYLDYFPLLFPSIDTIHSFHFLFSIALLFGLLSILFLRKKPEIEKSNSVMHSINSYIRNPLRDKNFIKLMRFRISWSFAQNLALPFFVVYLYQDLHLSYTYVAGYMVTVSIASLFGMWIWGHISDKTGNKPILIITVCLITILPFIWLFTAENRFSIYFLIPFLHIMGGFFGSGYNLCSTNFVFRLVPKENNSIYFSYWSGFTILAAGIGALTGGFIAQMVPDDFSFGFIHSDSVFKVVFFASFFLRSISVFFLRDVIEPKGMPVFRTILVLRSLRFWASTLGFHPSTAFFFARKKSKEGDSPYWPIWR